MRQLAAVLAIALGSTTAFALPPNSPYREGANHHVGDDSFIAKYGRRPTARDSEPVRMHEHFAYVRAWLASRPATRPELAAQRAKILAAFDAYIAKGTTPANEHLPWRTPVFIDDHHTICAVGFLIEQTAGRPLAEKIATKHRYDLLDDIAADMPEVRDWVAQSGLTLEELASIQPAYAEPEANTWRTWNLVKYPHPDGPYAKGGITGAFRHGMMDGPWTAMTDEPTGPHQLLGKGTFKHGAGAWTSFFPSGEKLAEGRYVDNRADGPWQIFFASGHLAAEGSFTAGTRTGKWRFYYDTAAQTPIATGAFDAHGWVSGTWHHYDAHGARLATSRVATPDLWGDTDPSIDGGDGSLLELTPGADGIHHEIHEGTVGGLPLRLDHYSRGHEHIYVQSAYSRDNLFDAAGNLLTHGADGTWTASDCGWSTTRKAAARIGDTVRMHGFLYKDLRRRIHGSREDVIGGRSDGGADMLTADPGPTCQAPHAIAGPRAHELDALIADHDRLRAIPPAVVRANVLGEDSADESVTTAETLAENMTMYVEWPHIDGTFTHLFGTLPGRVEWHWYDGDPERYANQPSEE